MKLKALGLNCTLTPSPGRSHTEALLDRVLGHFRDWDVETEMIRVVDHNVLPGIESDMGDGDEWPIILDKMKEADIIILGTPIWFGLRSSIAQQVFERLDGTYRDTDPENGQFTLYGKVAGVVVTGNEDGAHDAAATTLYNFSHLGLVIPPNADCYWVGDAGPGPSYLDAGGPEHVYTNRGARLVAYNCFDLATMLKQTPIKTDMNKVMAEAVQDSQIGFSG